MAVPEASEAFPYAGARNFSTTHWSAVLDAGGESAESSTALENLCRNYWYPLYAYVRREGHSAEDAQDLTQEFFARMIEKKYLKLANPKRGRFRTFLLTSLQHFLVNEWHKEQTTKRGGRHTFLSLDDQTAESRYLAEPIDRLTPDRLYDNRWAVELLDRVLVGLRDEYVEAGKALLFDALKSQALGESATEAYGAMAQRLNMSEGALRVAAHRLRERYRELLRIEVGQTVTSPNEVDSELRHLIAALRK